MESYGDKTLVELKETWLKPHSVITLHDFIYKPVKGTMLQFVSTFSSVKDFWCYIFINSVITIFGLFHFVKSSILFLVEFHFLKTSSIFMIWVTFLSNNTFKGVTLSFIWKFCCGARALSPKGPFFFSVFLCFC